MSDQPDSLILVYLRRLDEKFDRVGADVGDIKLRMTAVEEALAGVNRRLDRIEGRVDRIERRLDLIDHPA
jgi:hypothetical protein